MATGNLDRRITLANYTQTGDGSFGEVTKTYTTLATVWAWIRFKEGNERLFQTKETVSADCIFTIRYRTSITEKTRITYDSVNYDILHIAEVGRRKYLELTARKIQ